LKKQLSKGKNNPAKNARSSAAVPKNNAPAISPVRRRLFRLFALLVLPLALLLVVELGLRLAGIGHDTGFFRKVTVRNREFLVDNESFTLRFFPPQLARWPSPVMFEAKKPANTYRIFILGESAARGEPEPNYAASRYLQVMLQNRFPDIHFEIINLGITAINSHVILPIARNCAKADGDLWIIYMGNNEMVGPFGAATVFGSKAPPLPAVRLNLALQKSRIAQLLLDFLRSFKGKNENSSWGGMKMFIGNQLATDDPRKEIVYNNFQKNLQDILKIGLDSGVKIILNNVAVNLADCPPFASLSPTNLAPSSKDGFEKLYALGNAAFHSNDFKSATKFYGDALKLNPQYAELHYMLGKCHLALSNSSAAGSELRLACDLDALPFRTGTRINRIISDEAAKLSAQNLSIVDATVPFDAASPAGISGAESFFEHVHFTFEGNYLLARIWAPEVEKLIPKEKLRATNSWMNEEDCEKRLALSDWNRGGIMESILYRLNRPPLKDQSNNAERLASLKKDIELLGKKTSFPEARASANAMFTKAIHDVPDDHYLHENYADFLENIDDMAGSSGEWQKVSALLPEASSGWYQWGRALNRNGKPEDAINPLQNALRIRPNLTEAWFELGQAQLATHRTEEALHSFKRTHEIDPANAAYMAWMGKVLSQLKRHAESGELFKKAISIQPDLWDAHMAYGEDLASENRLEEALEHFNIVAKNQPSSALAHFNTAVILARLGRYDDSISELNATLELQPGNRQAKEYLDRVNNWKNKSR
jgi:tetratricopeptide (TPR) repeat protein